MSTKILSHPVVKEIGRELLITASVAILSTLGKAAKKEADRITAQYLGTGNRRNKRRKHRST